MTAILGRFRSGHPWAVLAVALVASLAHARPPTTPVSGLVSIADGGSFTVIRRDDLRTGSKGITLLAGDIVETGPDTFLVVEMQGGSLLGIGPSSAVYWTERGGALTLYVRTGWIKADIRPEAVSGTARVMGPRLGVQCHQAVVVLHIQESADELFDEQGTATLLLRDNATKRAGKETRPSQFLRTDDREDLTAQVGPSSDFLAQLPIAFRDTLPATAAAPATKPLEPRWLRKATYLDIQPWLTAPLAWRTGFIARFRDRLKDRAFFAAMDAHLGLHPEWAPILHPKPPPDDVRPQAGSPPQAQPPSQQSQQLDSIERGGAHR